MQDTTFQPKTSQTYESTSYTYSTNTQAAQPETYTTDLKYSGTYNSYLPSATTQDYTYSYTTQPVGQTYTSSYTTYGTTEPLKSSGSYLVPETYGTTGTSLGQSGTYTTTQVTTTYGTTAEPKTYETTTSYQYGNLGTAGTTAQESSYKDITYEAPKAYDLGTYEATKSSTYTSSYPYETSYNYTSSVPQTGETKTYEYTYTTTTDAKPYEYTYTTTTDTKPYESSYLTSYTTPATEEKPKETYNYTTTNYQTTTGSYFSDTGAYQPMTTYQTSSNYAGLGLGENAYQSVSHSATPLTSVQTDTKNYASAPVSKTDRRSILNPYRNTLFKEFDEVVEDLPDRTNLLQMINSTLKKSPAHERLLASPAKVDINRTSVLQPAKIIVETPLVEKYEDGSIYEGESRKGKREGKGKITYLNGDYLLAEFMSGKIDGPGVLYNKVGEVIFEGNFDNNVYHGEGKLNNVDVTPLEGEFNFKDFSGLGNGWRRYEGDFKNGKKNGVGILYLSNGEKYYGEFKDDKIHGKGNFYLKGQEDGAAGEWEDNKLVELF